jgi:hypothetical protein
VKISLEFQHTTATAVLDAPNIYASDLSRKADVDEKDLRTIAMQPGL